MSFPTYRYLKSTKPQLIKDWSKYIVIEKPSGIYGSITIIGNKIFSSKNDYSDRVAKVVDAIRPLIADKYQKDTFQLHYIKFGGFYPGFKLEQKPVNFIPYSPGINYYWFDINVKDVGYLPYREVINIFNQAVPQAPVVISQEDLRQAFVQSKEWLTFDYTLKNMESRIPDTLKLTKLKTRAKCAGIYIQNADEIRQDSVFAIEICQKNEWRSFVKKKLIRELSAEMCEKYVGSAVEKKPDKITKQIARDFFDGLPGRFCEIYSKSDVKKACYDVVCNYMKARKKWFA